MGVNTHEPSQVSTVSTSLETKLISA